MTPDLVLNLFAGPGGWCVAADRLGLTPNLGLEIDPAACLTRASAGHLTVRSDLTAFDVAPLAARVRGLVASPVCISFSAAGKRGGIALMDVLDALIRDLMAGKRTRAARRREMARALRASWWPDPKLTREKRSAAIWKAVRSASLVAEPARFIHACHPEWVAMEQVPSVLPLWRVYAEELRKLGYSAWCGTVNSADFGVPQTRIRAILIASRVRTVRRPYPTHYDARKGGQLFGEPWVSMADALGLGATARPSPTVTAGGTGTGGAEPFGHRDRDALAAEMDAGRWALRKTRGKGMTERHGERVDRPASQPAPTVTAGSKGSGPRLEWVLHTNRGQDENGDRQTRDPRTALTSKSGGQWVLKSGNQPHAAVRPAPAPTIAFGHNSSSVTWHLRNNSNDNACERALDEPAGTLFFGQRSNWAAWVQERPATTVVGRGARGRPGHKDRNPGGEPHFAVDSVRITVAEAAALQSFPRGYPWKGTKTKQYEQCGNAFPPLAAIAVLGEAAGIPWEDAAADYRTELAAYLAEDGAA